MRYSSHVTTKDHYSKSAIDKILYLKYRKYQKVSDEQNVEIRWKGLIPHLFHSLHFTHFLSSIPFCYHSLKNSCESHPKWSSTTVYCSIHTRPFMWWIQLIPLISHVLIVDIICETTIEFWSNKIYLECVPERSKWITLLSTAAVRVVTRHITEGCKDQNRTWLNTFAK